MEGREIKKLVTKSGSVKYCLPAEEIFDVVKAVNLPVEHGGRYRLKNETSRKYANVTTEVINIKYLYKNIFLKSKK